MDGDAQNMVDVQWLARYPNRSRHEWPPVDVASIEDAALERWRAEWLRELQGEEAAALWLQPLPCSCGTVAAAEPRIRP